MSTRSNPIEEIERLFDRMSRQFEAVSREWGSREPVGWAASSVGPMAIDLVEYDDRFVASVDLPGFEREDVEIEVTEHVLRIEAEREESVDEDEQRFLRHERRHASAGRSVRLPDAVDTDRVEAGMKNGVLTVTLPRLESEGSRAVEIEVE